MAPDETPDDAPPPGTLALDARAQLQRSREAMTAATGGVAPGRVLAELAQTLAGELAPHFDELPMHRFTGWVPRAAGALGWLLPARRIPHRVVMGRYLSATPPARTSPGWTRRYASVAVLALGADGVLRHGRQGLYVALPEDHEVATSPHAWSHLHLARIPSRPLRLARWEGDPDPRHVAGARLVIDVLAAIADRVATDIGKDLALMRKFGIADGGA